MKVKLLKDQNIVLKKLLGISVPIPEELPTLSVHAEGYFLIPSWQRIAPTYNEALEKVLKAIASTRPFFNWREGKLGPEYLIESSAKNKCPEIVAAQLGSFHKGQSVTNVRANIGKDEILLGAYEIGIILLTHPEALEKYEDLWIDCAGDEYDDPDSDVRFDHAPCFLFSDGRLEFGTKFVDRVNVYYGAASGFSAQSNLDSRSLDTVESSTLPLELEINGITYVRK